MVAAPNTPEQAYVVIDVETTTPKGHAPEPIEIGAVAGSLSGHDVSVGWHFASFVRPPAHAPLTVFDTQQTGITAEDLSGAEVAADVLARLDGLVGDEVLVAHNATVEAGVLSRYRDSCPVLAGRDILCSWRLAKQVLPDLTSHRLDEVVRHYAIPPHPDRHRALADCELTLSVLAHLMSECGRYSAFDRRHILARATVPSRANRATQLELF